MNGADGHLGVVGRTHTAIYYSNEEFQQEDGGDLRIWPADHGTTAHEAADIAPLPDRLVVFESSLVHEVRAYRGMAPRCAFTQWFSALGEAVDVNHVMELFDVADAPAEL